MVSYAGLRTLVGAKKFDKVMKAFKSGQKDTVSAPIELSSMNAEPANSGLSIPDGRRALKKATKHTFSLPSLEI